MPTPEIDSLEFRRTIFRRFRVGVMLCLVLVPALMWLLVNLAGKSKWRQVQKEMKRQGVALHFSELDLPTRSDVPDAENFCAIPWLTANDNYSASAELGKAADELSALCEFTISSKSDGNVSYLGSLSLGQPANIIELGFGPELELDANTKNANSGASDTESLEAIAEARQELKLKLSALAPRWQQLEQAMDRPKAHWLPTFRDLSYSGRSPLERRLPARIILLRNLTIALGLQALTALDRGDAATAVRSIEIQWRIIDAVAREPGKNNLQEAHGLARDSLRTTMHCLWSPVIVNDSESLRRLQVCIESVDFAELHQLASERELAIMVGGILHARDHRDPDSAGLVSSNDGWQAVAEDALPSGWYDSVAAEAAEIYTREVIVQLRDNGSFERNFQESKDLRDLHRSFHNEDRMRPFRQPVHIFMTTHAWLLMGSFEIESRHRQAIIACALYRYALANDGKFPAELDNLAPDLIDSVPPDPLSLQGADGQNQAMGYLATDENAPGPPFQLWSVGFDMQDDGGKLNLEADDYGYTIDKFTYLGDWPWHVEPLAIEDTEEKDE